MRALVDIVGLVVPTLTIFTLFYRRWVARRRDRSESIARLLRENAELDRALETINRKGQ